MSRVRVAGESPFWPVGQAVKTPPFHGGIPGSIPGRVTTWTISSAGRAPALQAGCRQFDPVIVHQRKRLSSDDRFFVIEIKSKAYRTKSVCKNPYNTRYLLVL